jgi:putative oxidoreductase
MGASAHARRPCSFKSAAARCGGRQGSGLKERAQVQGNLDEWAPVPIRLVSGAGLMYHGAPKLFSRRGHENIVHLLKETGAPDPELTSWGVGALEFFGGLCLVLGVRTRPIAAVVCSTVVFNLAHALRQGGWPDPLPGCQPLPHVEDSFFYGGCTAALVLSGPGRLAVQAAVGAGGQ